MSWLHQCCGVLSGMTLWSYRWGCGSSQAPLVSFRAGWAGTRSTAVPQYRSCLEIPHYSWCPDCMGEGQLFQPLIPSFLAGGGLLENIQLLTIQLMYTLAGDCE